MKIKAPFLTLLSLGAIASFVFAQGTYSGGGGGGTAYLIQDSSSSSSSSTASPVTASSVAQLPTVFATNTTEHPTILLNASVAGAAGAASYFLSNGIYQSRGPGLALSPLGSGLMQGNTYGRSANQVATSEVDFSITGTNIAFTFLTVRANGAGTTGATNAWVDFLVDGKRESTSSYLIPDTGSAYNISMSWGAFGTHAVTVQFSGQTLMQAAYGPSNTLVQTGATYPLSRVVVLGNSEVLGDINSGLSGSAHNKTWPIFLADALHWDAHIQAEDGSTLVNGTTLQNRFNEVTNKWSNPDMVFVDYFDEGTRTPAAIAITMTNLGRAIHSIVPTTTPIIWVTPVETTLGQFSNVNAACVLNEVSYPTDKHIYIQAGRAFNNFAPYAVNSHINSLLHQHEASYIAWWLSTNYFRKVL